MCGQSVDEPATKPAPKPVIMALQTPSSLGEPVKPVVYTPSKPSTNQSVVISASPSVNPTSASNDSVDTIYKSTNFDPVLIQKQNESTLDVAPVNTTSPVETDAFESKESAASTDIVAQMLLNATKSALSNISSVLAPVEEEPATTASPVATTTTRTTTTAGTTTTVSPNTTTTTTTTTTTATPPVDTTTSSTTSAPAPADVVVGNKTDDAIETTAAPKTTSKTVQTLAPGLPFYSETKPMSEFSDSFLHLMGNFLLIDLITKN